MTTLTDKEVQVLTNIVLNEYQPMNGGEPDTYADIDVIWNDTLNDGPFDLICSSIPGVVGSLSKKGLVRVNGDCIYLTAQGFSAYKHLQ